MTAVNGTGVTKVGSVIQLVALDWDQAAHRFTFSVAGTIVAICVVLLVLIVLWKWRIGAISFSKFEIDQAEIGVGASKFSFRPNETDRQVAYAIWVELSTRKIGLPIDFEHDVISEIYDSWYTFFSVTRDLVKGIPVSQIKRAGTKAIIKLSIEVLNEGLRPHLTHWQARFRRWYDRELKRYDETSGEAELDPQMIQSRFPHYKDLTDDMRRVNDALMRYRQKMHELVLKD